MDDLGKQFEAFNKKVKAVIKNLPRVVGVEAKNFFQDNFNKQGWQGNRMEPWKKRKPNTKKNKGRAILVDTGRLKRSIRVISYSDTSVIVGTDVPYAKLHNEGFKGNVTIPQHTRTASRKVSTKIKKDGKFSKAKSAMKKIKSKTHTVKAHTRKVNMPKRQFIGDSPYLQNRLERKLMADLMKL